VADIISIAIQNALAACMQNFPLVCDINLGEYHLLETQNHLEIINNIAKVSGLP
jgi:hypothetical protein